MVKVGNSGFTVSRCTARPSQTGRKKPLKSWKTSITQGVENRRGRKSDRDSVQTGSSAGKTEGLKLWVGDEERETPKNEGGNEAGS